MQDLIPAPLDADIYAVVMPTLPALLLDTSDAVALTIEAAIWAEGVLPVEWVLNFADGHPLDDSGNPIDVPPGWTVLYGRTPEVAQRMANGHAGQIHRATVNGQDGQNELAALWAVAYGRLANSLATSREDVDMVTAAYVASLATAMANLAN